MIQYKEEVRKVFIGDIKDVAQLGAKKTEISFALNQLKLKKSGKGGKGNSYFNRGDYIGPLLNELQKHKCYINFCMTEETAILYFVCSETGAQIVSYMPWSRVNIETKYNKNVLDAMQEIGAGSTYAKRYLEVFFFDLAEDDFLDMPDQEEEKKKKDDLKLPDSLHYLETPDGKYKLFNPPLNCKEDKKIHTMFAWAKVDIPNVDPEKLIKTAIGMMLRHGLIDSDSKKKFPLHYMGALNTLITQIKNEWENKWKEMKVKEKMKGNNNGEKK